MTKIVETINTPYSLQKMVKLPIRNMNSHDDVSDILRSKCRLNTHLSSDFNTLASSRHSKIMEPDVVRFHYSKIGKSYHPYTHSDQTQNRFCIQHDQMKVDASHSDFFGGRSLGDDAFNIEMDTFFNTPRSNTISAIKDFGKDLKHSLAIQKSLGPILSFKPQNQDPSNTLLKTPFSTNPNLKLMNPSKDEDAFELVVNESDKFTTPKNCKTVGLLNGVFESMVNNNEIKKDDSPCFPQEEWMDDAQDDLFANFFTNAREY